MTAPPPPADRSPLAALRPLLLSLLSLLIIPSLPLCAYLCFTPSAAHADVPAQRQALILARALAYDRNLKSRVGDTLTIGILFLAGNASSEKQRDEISSAFQETAKFKIQGLDVLTVNIPLSTPANLEATFRDQGVDALYLTDGLSDDLPAIIDLTRRVHISSMSNSEAYRTEGVSLLILVKDNKPTIVVNLSASRAEGMDLSAELLGLAEVIK
jgi:hypothetical protein